MLSRLCCAGSRCGLQAPDLDGKALTLSVSQFPREAISHDVLHRCCSVGELAQLLGAKEEQLLVWRTRRRTGVCL